MNETMFERNFRPRMEKCPKVTLTEQQMKFVRDFVARLYKRKIDEYPWDAKNIIDRNVIGRMCEYGFLGGYGKADYFDDSFGHSTEYDAPDLWQSPKHKRHLPDPRIPVDIKGANVERRNTPLIEKEQKVVAINGIRYRCPEVICLGDLVSGEVWILGIASPEVLTTYSSESLIKNANNNKKTAFFGADKLVDIPKTWEELRTVCNSLLAKV